MNVLIVISQMEFFIKVLILWLVTILISPIFIIEIYKITKKLKFLTSLIFPKI